MKVLIIDNEPKVREFIARGFRAESYAVDIASDGEEGYGLFQSYSYDLILMDLKIPKIDGFQLMQRIRERNKLVPVMIVTARDGIEDKIRLFEAGADDYLTKPFAFAELLLRSKALLRRATPNRVSVLVLGDLELDRLTQTVTRAGKQIVLTTKEYALLEYLMLNTGRVLSRNMVIEHVWDQSFDGITNIVDVYVRHLRVKVDNSPCRTMIRTIRGSGYLMCREG